MKPNKFPINLTYHARHQAIIRGLDLSRMSDLERKDWTLRAGTVAQVGPPKWQLKSDGAVMAYYYTLSEVMSQLGQIPVVTKGVTA